MMAGSTRLTSMPLHLTHGPRHKSHLGMALDLNVQYLVLLSQFPPPPLPSSQSDPMISGRARKRRRRELR